MIHWRMINEFMCQLTAFVNCLLSNVVYLTRYVVRFVVSAALALAYNNFCALLTQATYNTYIKPRNLLWIVCVV